MSELVKRDVSLAVLRVRLSETSPTSATEAPVISTGIASAVSTAEAGATPIPLLVTKPRVTCDLEVTGDARIRGLALPAGQTAADVNTDGATARTVAQWNFAAEEIHLPIQFTDVVRFNDKPNLAGELMATLARTTVATFFPQFRADAFERLAAAKSWFNTGKPTLPSTMIQQLKDLLPSLLRDDDVLWLELAEPVGYLSLLPWEEMLQAVTPVPLLRLSPHCLKALSADRELSVILCVTVPSREWIPATDELTALVDAIRNSLPPRSKLHIFADDLCHPQFTAAAAGRTCADDNERVIILHPLPDSAENEVQGKTLSTQPWITWIINSLAGSAVDIVHCFSPGLLFEDQPRLVIARDANPGLQAGEISPDTDSVRLLGYVTPLEHSDMLTTLGAWGAIFSAPSSGPESAQSQLGLRSLVDQLARLRPGVAAFHDFANDPRCESLAQTYRFIIEPDRRATRSASMAVYCHPARAANVPVAPLLGADELMKQYARVEEKIQSAIDGPVPTPMWVAATQRIVEQTMASIGPLEAKDPDSATVRGVTAGLKFIEQMLTEQEADNVSQDVGPKNEVVTDA